MVNGWLKALRTLLKCLGIWLKAFRMLSREFNLHTAGWTGALTRPPRPKTKSFFLGFRSSNELQRGNAELQ